MTIEAEVRRIMISNFSCRRDPPIAWVENSRTMLGRSAFGFSLFPPRSRISARSRPIINIKIISVKARMKQNNNGIMMMIMTIFIARRALWIYKGRRESELEKETKAEEKFNDWECSERRTAAIICKRFPSASTQALWVIRVHLEPKWHEFD